MRSCPIAWIVESDFMPCPILPEHKDDWAAVDRLQRVVAESGHHEDLRAILPGMLEWTVDPQWPIADAMGGLVAGAGLSALGPITSAFVEADDDGRTGMSLTVVMKMSKDARAALCSMLEGYALGSFGQSVREVAAASLDLIREAAESGSESRASSGHE